MGHDTYWNEILRGIYLKKYIGLLAALFLFSGCSDAEEKPKEMDAVSSSVVEVKEPLNEQQQITLDSLSDFNSFANNYANVEPIERTVLWDDYVSGTEVTWTGTVVEVWDSEIILIDSNYYDGTLFQDLNGKPGIYRVFIADFNYDIATSTITPGQQLTISGDLDSRGNPSDPFSNWKIYNAEIMQ